jgi:hypothetical protein
MSQQVTDRVDNLRRSIGSMADGSLKTALQTELDAMATAVQNLQVQVPPGAQAGAAQTDLSTATAVDAFIATATGTYEEKRKALAIAVKDNIRHGAAIRLRDTSVIDELTYYKETGTGDAKTDIKSLNAITVFKGGSDIAWRQWEYPWIQAVRNRKITESDLKTALFQRLQDSAAQYYMSIENIETLSFGEILQKLRERYTHDKLRSENLVRGVSQQPKEDVRDYAARMINAAKGMLPEQPRQLKVLITDTKSYVIPNPELEEEQAKYTAVNNIALSQLTGYFLAGLRPEITSRLPTRKYADFHELVRSAEDAQWIKDSISLGMIHTVQEDNSDEVNALAKGKKEKGSFKGKGKGQDQAAGASKPPAKTLLCYRCKQPGHLIRSCPYPAEQPSFKRKNTAAKGDKKDSSSLPWSPKDPRRRRWMLTKRAQINQRFRQRRQAYATLEETADAMEYSPEEQELFNLEQELFESEEDEHLYWQELQEFEEQADSKN